MSARDELADVFTGHPVGFGTTPPKLMRGHAQEIAEAILAAGYVKPEPSVPVEPEYEWGTSPYADGLGVTRALSEDQALWMRDNRGANIFRRPVPAAWELVKP